MPDLSPEALEKLADLLSDATGDMLFRLYMDELDPGIALGLVREVQRLRALVGGQGDELDGWRG